MLPDLFEEPSVPTFPAETLQSFAASLFRASGIAATEADQVAHGLVLANLCGHDSHGLIRIPQYLDAVGDGRFQPGAAFMVVKETPALLVADGGRGFGQVQAHRLLQRLIPMARNVGLAAGTLRHTGHIGRLGEYAEAAAAERMAFIATVNNHGFGRGVAPPGGTESRIGTNPLCLGTPTSGPPVILDIGTSVVTEGKVRVLFNKGQPVPEGWLLDARPVSRLPMRACCTANRVVPSYRWAVRKPTRASVLVCCWICSWAGCLVRRAVIRERRTCPPMRCCSLCWTWPSSRGRSIFCER